MDTAHHATFPTPLKDRPSIRLITVGEPCTSSQARSDLLAKLALMKVVDTLAAAAQTTAKQAKPFDLLDLPPEVRSQVYDHMIPLPRRDHLNFFVSCRKAHREACVSFFRRPLKCSTQARLMDFVAQRSQLNLTHVRTVTLHLQDIDAEKIQTFLEHISLNLVNKRHSNPYVLEQHRIADALSKLPNLRHIALIRPSHGMQLPPRSFVDDLFCHIGQSCGHLQSLQTNIDTFNIQVLKHFHCLRALSISGFTKATPRQILETLRSMTALQALRLIGASSGNTWRSRHFKCQDKISFPTPIAVQQMPAMKVLEIFELVDSRDPKPALLHPEMLKAICRTHARGLEHLTISSTAEPNSATIAFITGLLIMATSLHHLALTWPGMDFDLLDFLPETVKRLELAVTGSAQADAFLARLDMMRHRLPFLRNIKLLVINEAAIFALDSGNHKEPHTVALGMPLSLPPASVNETSGWEITWGIWQLVPAS